MKIGPGKYESKFKLVEPRLDKGAVALKPDVGIHQSPKDEREPLYPFYEFDKPNKLTIKMMPETEIVPPNIPDSQIKPEHWNFYDANLDAVRPGIEVFTFG